MWLCSETPHMEVKKVSATDYRLWLLLPKDYTTQKLNIPLEEMTMTTSTSIADATEETISPQDALVDTSESEDTPVMPNLQNSS